MNLQHNALHTIFKLFEIVFAVLVIYLFPINIRLQEVVFNFK